MDVIGILKQDHEEVEALFTRIEGASARAMKTKQTVFHSIKAALSMHADAEEQIVYPRMQKIPELRKNALKAYVEHHIVKLLLAELSSDEDGSEAWDAKITVLIDLVRSHVEEEEKQDFKVMKSELDRQELQQLGEALVAFKTNYVAQAGKTASASPGTGMSQTLHH